MRCQSCEAATPAGARFCPGCGVGLGAAGDPRTALLEATRLIAADAGRDLDATLDTLTSQASRLLADTPCGVVEHFDRVSVQGREAVEVTNHVLVVVEDGDLHSLLWPSKLLAD